tara:strand:- start:480 stop:716 length:237 start_codon:yes stop_codon:yes gene_type:complete
MDKRVKELFHKDKRELINTIINLEKQMETIEQISKSRLQDALFHFIEYFTEDEMERVDMKVIAENYTDPFMKMLRREE